MVLGAILGTILGSKSHLKIDQKSDQILDRFWKDFGSQNGSILDQFWLQKSIKNQGRKKFHFWRIAGESPGYQKWLREGPFITEVDLSRSNLGYDNVSYTPDSTGCCGGFWDGFGSPGPFPGQVGEPGGTAVWTQHIKNESKNSLSTA